MESSQELNILGVFLNFTHAVCSLLALLNQKSRNIAKARRDCLKIRTFDRKRLGTDTKFGCINVFVEKNMLVPVNKTACFETDSINSNILSNLKANLSKTLRFLFPVVPFISFAA